MDGIVPLSPVTFHSCPTLSCPNHAMHLNRRFLFFLALALLSLAGIVYLGFDLASPRAAPPMGSSASPTANPSPPPPATGSDLPSQSAAPARANLPAAPAPATTLDTTAPLTASLREQVLDAIQSAATTYDTAALPHIQPYLVNTDPEVRSAALNGVIVLGESAGAALLRAAASQLKDPREAVAYLDAAEYLELPSGTLIQPGSSFAADKPGSRPPQVDSAAQDFRPPLARPRPSPGNNRTQPFRPPLTRPQSKARASGSPP
jgi:hypothetical protein